MGVKKIKSLVCMQTFQKNHLNDFGYYELKARYELFLSKDVKIGMFIACDLEGNVLSEPKWKDNTGGVVSFEHSNRMYQQAKERILFEDWIYDFEDEYLVFKIGDKTDELFLDFEEIEGFKLIDLIEECFILSQTALNEIYEES